MHRTLRFEVAIALCIALSTSICQAAPAQTRLTAAGLWEKTDAAGNREAWFRIYECNGVHDGKIVNIFAKRGEDPSTWRCTQCDGKRRNAPVVGITFIEGMRRQGLEYEGGTILDPRDGSVYSALMRLSPDGKQLTVRGYLGLPLLGRDEVWHRIADRPQYQTNPCSNGDRP